uniref:Eukaryotic peptide chain release factor GTP-binding subunit ERF3A n=2 Tax=Schistocephalus solidus TaxID=70667 RepID=A0A0X3NR54_SCHSO
MASWEDEVDPKISDSFSKINIDAPEFIPGRPYNFEALSTGTGWSAQPLSDPSPTDDIQIAANVPETEEENEAFEEVVRKPVSQPSVPINRKETLSVVFIGHVDAGKSTIGGHLLHLTGMVDKRTLEKFAKEAKDKNRETWYLSWALDTNLEERDKGITVECGRAFFETENKHFILVDAPGHKSFVPNMITGAAIADLAILVISARRGEFETGFEKGGQTREHAMLVKTAGVKHLIVLINKMDDSTVGWDERRYNECKNKLSPFLKKLGFNTKSDVFFMPCSGFTGAFLRDPAPESVCPWYRGPCLLQYLDELPSLTRCVDGPVRIPIVDRYRDMGTFVFGKIESGSVFRGQMLTMMPNKVSVEVLQVFSDDMEVESSQAGDNVKLKLKNIEEEDISPGFVLCSPDNLCHAATIFDAQVVILDCKSIICRGFTAVMHVHACVEEVRFRTIICRIDKKTNEKTDVTPRFIKQDDVAIVRFEMLGGAVCVECFRDFAQMGRFTLRDEGKTIAVGKIVKILPSTSSD